MEPLAELKVMEWSRCFKLFFFLSLLALAGARELKVRHKLHVSPYDPTLARTLVEYASAVYMSDLTSLITWTCERCNGMTKGFEMTELIVDVQHCLQAYVGVAEDLKAIIVAFRGTQEHSIQNWVEDLFWKQLDVNYPGMPYAMVHHGFYSAYHNTTVRPGILDAIDRAKELYGDLQIMVTGHSMGGAMASFCALDLVVNHIAHNIYLMTFGQPRVGNAAFSSYFSKVVQNATRITNRHDIVPHLPPYSTLFPQKTYHHFAREVWLYDIGLGSLVYTVEKVCDSTGEDLTCSRSVIGNSIVDHLKYFGVDLEAETWGSCTIVMDKSILSDTANYSSSFVLTRNPFSSDIMLKRPMSASS